MNKVYLVSRNNEMPSFYRGVDVTKCLPGAKNEKNLN